MKRCTPAFKEQLLKSKTSGSTPVKKYQHYVRNCEHNRMLAKLHGHHVFVPTEVLTEGGYAVPLVTELHGDPLKVSDPKAPVKRCMTMREAREYGYEMTARHEAALTYINWTAVDGFGD